MTEAEPLFDLLRQFADPGIVGGVEKLVRDGSDSELVGINPHLEVFGTDYDTPDGTAIHCLPSSM